MTKMTKASRRRDRYLTVRLSATEWRMLVENVKWSGAKTLAAYARPALLRTFRDDVPDPQTQWALIEEVKQATEALYNARPGPEMDKALEAAGELFDRLPTR